MYIRKQKHSTTMISQYGERSSLDPNSTPVAISQNSPRSFPLPALPPPVALQQQVAPGVAGWAQKATNRARHPWKCKLFILKYQSFFCCLQIRCARQVRLRFPKTNLTILLGIHNNSKLSCPIAIQQSPYFVCWHELFWRGQYLKNKQVFYRRYMYYMGPFCGTELCRNSRKYQKIVRNNRKQ